MYQLLVLPPALGVLRVLYVRYAALVPLSISERLVLCLVHIWPPELPLLVLQIRLEVLVQQRVEGVDARYASTLVQRVVRP